jgi:hypothetical protein
MPTREGEMGTTECNPSPIFRHKYTNLINVSTLPSVFAAADTLRVVKALQGQLRPTGKTYQTIVIQAIPPAFIIESGMLLECAGVAVVTPSGNITWRSRNSDQWLRLKNMLVRVFGPGAWSHLCNVAVFTLVHYMCTNTCSIANKRVIATLQLVIHESLDL